MTRHKNLKKNLNRLKTTISLIEDPKNSAVMNIKGPEAKSFANKTVSAGSSLMCVALAQSATLAQPNAATGAIRSLTRLDSPSSVRSTKAKATPQKAKLNPEFGSKLEVNQAIKNVQ